MKIKKIALLCVSMIIANIAKPASGPTSSNKKVTFHFPEKRPTDMVIIQVLSACESTESDSGKTYDLEENNQISIPFPGPSEALFFSYRRDRGAIHTASHKPSTILELTLKSQWLSASESEYTFLIDKSDDTLFKKAYVRTALADNGKFFYAFIGKEEQLLAERKASREQLSSKSKKSTALTVMRAAASNVKK